MNENPPPPGPRLHAHARSNFLPDYGADPLLCPRCGGAMKIVAFIEARQANLIRKILEHCGLWHDPPARSPPTSAPPAQVATRAPDPDSGLTYEPDGDFLEHARREEQPDPEPPAEP